MYVYKKKAFSKTEMNESKYVFAIYSLVLIVFGKCKYAVATSVATVLLCSDGQRGFRFCLTCKLFCWQCLASVVIARIVLVKFVVFSHFMLPQTVHNFYFRNFLASETRKKKPQNNTYNLQLPMNTVSI